MIAGGDEGAILGRFTLLNDQVERIAQNDLLDRSVCNRSRTSVIKMRLLRLAKVNNLASSWGINATQQEGGVDVRDEGSMALKLRWTVALQHNQQSWRGDSRNKSRIRPGWWF